MTETLTTASMDTIPITDARIEREEPLAEHMDITPRELLERVAATPWALLAANAAENSTLSEQQARINTLESFNISRQLIAELLEVSPNTIDTHKQAMKKKTDQSDLTETVLHGRGYRMKETSVNYILDYQEATVEPAQTPERLFFVNHDPVNEETTYVERVTTHRERPVDEVIQVGDGSRRSEAGETVQQTEYSFFEYDCPVAFAYESMASPGGMIGTDPDQLYDALCDVPVFTMGIDEFTTRWEHLEEEKAKTVLNN